ncbi:MAG TPA: TIGR03118 family protein [Candidatus Saccharimonadia bacterium]|nr:TIGR03118 family protein [Candidatus Saccharimonadia bacterium]
MVVSKGGPGSLKRGLIVVEATALVLSFVLPAGVAQAFGGGSYIETKLASDVPGAAAALDPSLVNPWGLSHSPTGPWWISDNDAGSSSIYTGKGDVVAPAISIPAPDGTAHGGTPTGNVFNPVAATMPQAFAVKQGAVSGPSSFIFATEDGTIAGWNRSVNSASAVVAVNRSAATDTRGDVGAVYKGLAFGSSYGQNYIYATNFRFGTVEMFDQNFHLVKSFTDSRLAADCPLAGQCYAPFGIQTIRGQLYVTFALQGPDKHDDQAGAGHGFVDVFNADGTLQRRLIAGGQLNSPWGVALAPDSFGRFSDHLLVGNFGDGTINAYDVSSGNFDSKLKDQYGRAIQADGLWALAFGNDGAAGRQNELFFTAGLSDEAHGLFGKITAKRCW